MRAGWFVAAVLALAGGVLIWAMSSGDADRPDEPRRDELSMDEMASTSPVVSWIRVVEVDSGAGHVGPWRMNRSDWRYVDDPSVTLDADGDAAVAWVDQARKDVLFQRYGRDGQPLLEAPVNVSRSSDVFSWLPRVAIPADDGDRVYLLWQEIVFSGGTHGGEAFFARSVDGGRSFETPVNLSRTLAGAGKGRLTPRLWHNGSLDLALGPDDEVYAAWTVYEGGLWLARSEDGGDSFAAALRVTAEGGEGEPARAPSLAVGPDGTVHLAWTVGGDPAADLRHAISEDGGRSFPGPRLLFEGDGRADAPKLAVDRQGILHLAYGESPAGGVGAGRVLYARGDAAGAFEEPRKVTGGNDVDGLAAGFPSLALDGQDDPYLVWELYAAEADRPRGLGFAASRDGGATFAEATVVPGSDDPAFVMNGSLQGLLMRKLAVNEAGDVAVVNSSFAPGEASRIVLAQGRVDRR